MITNVSYCVNNTATNETYCYFKYEKNITRCNRDKNYMVQNNTIAILNAFGNTSMEKYDEGNLYSFHLFNLNFTSHPILDDKWISLTPVSIRLYDPKQALMELSNPYESSNFITYTPDRELYHDFYEWSTCDMYGCTMNCTQPERQALVDLFNAT